ncbi:M16 family metallopeptidase [Lutibaculum baratangense]|uniref:Zinc protease n=1 Tax=Lutibaculum baratangense AMV1 TaxID=631454 RepID=V4TP89_9HYPH|nr:pitrilysin family protein [Lutibaculum baratangense]ESR27498.1 Zinc protease [Lutibaculum baratangense AMV1]
MLSRALAGASGALPLRNVRMLGVAVLLSVATAAPADASQFGENVETFTLENGLDVVVIPDGRAPVVTHMVWYRVGAADEPPGVSGIAHFLEHLMFKGTEAHPEGEFSRVISELGGQENAFTSSDYTAYFQRVSKEHLKTMMEFEADRMTGLVLAPEQVASEREVIIEERRSRIDNDPSAQLGEAMDAALYMNSPYGRPIIGWPDEMANLSREDAISFYEAHYTPNNAILVVAGDVSPQEVRVMAEETYGQVEPRGEPGPRVRPQEPPHLVEMTVSLASPRVDQESMRRAWLVPSYTTAEDGEAPALDVLNEILTGGSTSRFYRELVVGRQLATAAGGYYQGTALDAGKFMVYAVPRPGVELETLTSAITEVIEGFVEGGVTDVEFERAKRSLIASTVYAQDSQQTLARIYGAALTTGSSVEDVNGWIGRIEAVEKEDVVEVARKYLDPETGVIGYLRSKPGVQAAAEGANPLPVPTEEITQ